MNWVLAQVVLGARDIDSDGWMQLVVFLILGVFWAVGGIMKARAEKEKQKKQQQEDGVRPSRPPRGPTVRSMIRGLRPEPVIKPPQREIQPKQPETVREVSPRPIARGRQMAGPAVQQRPLVRPRPRVTGERVTELMQKPKPAGEIAKKADKQREEASVQAFRDFYEKSKPKETTSQAGLSESGVSLDSVEQLRAAIIHYEIFGKCVSSREPCEQIWMR